MRSLRSVVVVALALCVAACGGGSGSSRLATPALLRGFSPIPPRPDEALQLPTLEVARQHSNAGLVQLSIPWTVLLAGTAVDVEVTQVRLPLADYYRANGMSVVVALDVTNGLNRAEEDPALVAAGRSITEPAIQQLYRDYVRAVDSILRPSYLSLAAETNLVRLIAQPAVYAAVVTMTNDAAADLQAQRTAAQLMMSVQVETAWGGLQGSQYVGITGDLTDFPFIDVLGLSSYPYLGGYASPGVIPADYYSRLVAATSLRVMVIEGGWPSVSVAGVTSTPLVQADYIRRQSVLLDNANAVGVFQITLTDLDLPFWPAGVAPFADNGLVDINLQPKPALAVWDDVLAR